MEPIHDNCRLIRNVWRYEIKEISSLFGLTYTIWGNYERGKTEPSPAVLLQMEKLTGITIRRLLTERITRDDLPTEPILTETTNERTTPPQYFLTSDSEKEAMKDDDTLPIVERLKRLEMAVFGG